MTERKRCLPFTVESILDQQIPGDITLGEFRRFLQNVDYVRRFFGEIARPGNKVLIQINVRFLIQEREAPDHMTIEEARRLGCSLDISGSYGGGGVPAREPEKV